MERYEACGVGLSNWSRTCSGDLQGRTGKTSLRDCKRRGGGPRRRDRRRRWRRSESRAAYSGRSCGRRGICDATIPVGRTGACRPTDWSVGERDGLSGLSRGRGAGLLSLQNIQVFVRCPTTQSSATAGSLATEVRIDSVSVDRCQTRSPHRAHLPEVAYAPHTVRRWTAAGPRRQEG